MKPAYDERVSPEEAVELFRRLSVRGQSDPLSGGPTPLDVAEALGTTPEEIERLLRRVRQGESPPAPKRPISWLRLVLAAVVVLALVWAFDPFGLARRAVYGTGLTADGKPRYGPDTSPWPLDPSFRPSVEPPDGHSLSVTGLGVIWGCGNHRFPQQPLVEGEARRRLETAARELAHFARDKALGGMRNPHPVRVSSRIPPEKVLTSFFLGAQYWNGGSSVSVTVPKGRDDEANAHFEAELDRAIEELLRTHGHSVKRMQEWKAKTGSP